MSRFHPLTVTDIRRDTRDAVVLTLTPPEEHRGAFAFMQGQYLTLRRSFDGEELRRSYSICSGRGDGTLRVAIKRVDGGAFSTWANEGLSRGDTVEAMPPMGKFHVDLDPSSERHHLAFAAGSGITPVLSIIKTTLAEEPNSRVTLVYSNSQISGIMFREELDDLKNEYMGRFSILHVLGGEAQDIDLFSGRIDDEKMDALFERWIDAESVDHAFICGPEGMMLTVAEGLKRHGLSEDRIKFELFASSQPGRAKTRAVSRQEARRGDMCEAKVTLDGTTRTFTMPKDGTAILDAALANNIDAPWSCKAGVCSTCRAKVLEGEVEMIQNQALEDYEVRAGYVLSCQCVPLSDKVVLSYDE